MFKMELKDSMRFKDTALVIYEDNKIQMNDFFKKKSTINNANNTVNEQQNTYQFNYKHNDSTVCVIL